MTHLRCQVLTLADLIGERRCRCRLVGVPAAAETSTDAATRGPDVVVAVSA